MRRAAELWNEGEKTLAHIHLAYASLPRCGEEQGLRLFMADELIEAGVAPETLMKAQGFDPRRSICRKPISIRRSPAGRRAVGATAANGRAARALVLRG